MTVTLLSFLVFLLTTCVGLLRAQTLLAAVTKEYHWVGMKNPTWETRDESTALCRKWGMRVASFRNAQEQSVIDRFPKYVSTKEIDLWLQMRRKPSGPFLYDDGTPVVYNRYDQLVGPTPSNRTGWDCVYAANNLRRKDAWWFEQPCQQRLWTVCENFEVDYHANEWEGTCDTGLKQSPIDLHKGVLMTQPLYWHADIIVQKPLEFTRDAYATDSFVIVNNGHTIKIMFNSAMTSSAKMSGYGLEEGFIFAQAHLHWGTSGFPGSEHALNGTRQSMEIHLVHYKSTYANLQAAVASNDPRALAVYGVFLEGVPMPKYPSTRLCPGCFVPPKWFETITANIPINYNNPVGKTVSARLDLRPLLPLGGEGFFRYHGSLTTPSCIEGVIWTINRDAVQVSQADVEIFQSVRDTKGRPLRSNFRPLRKATLEHKIEYFTVTPPPITNTIANLVNLIQN